MNAGKPPDPGNGKGGPRQGSTHDSDNAETLFTQTSEKVKQHPADTEFQRAIKLAVFDSLKRWLATGGREHLERARQKAAMLRKEPHE
mgnify:CR=1 FL=1